ncbi:MAG TPA: hypothetical protein VHL11_04520, partial [Phototrophicaceae bacterium]|nr:hypothetical protein [Phototrophicaceae bacterium]
EECRKPANLPAEKPQLIPIIFKEKILNPQNHDLQISLQNSGERDYINSISGQIKGFTAQKREKLLELLKRVGRVVFDEQVKNAKAHDARDWNYVVTSIERLLESTTPPTSPVAVNPSPKMTVVPVETEEERTRREAAQAARELAVRLATEARQAQLNAWQEATGEQPFEHWRIAYNQLELQLDRGSFDTWLRGAKLLRVDEGFYIVGVRNKYAAEMLQYRLYRSVKRVLGDVTGREVELCFEVWDAPPEPQKIEETPLFKLLAVQ